MSSSRTTHRTAMELPYANVWAWVGDQLGKGYSSNNSGDGPESGETTCHDMSSSESHSLAFCATSSTHLVMPIDVALLNVSCLFAGSPGYKSA